MVYNEIGKTGMKVSNLSFGASSLGGVFHGIREDEGIRAVHTAVDLLWSSQSRDGAGQGTERDSP